MELIELIIVAIVAFYAGWRGATWIHLMSFKNILEDMGVGEKELRNLAKKHDLKIEDEDGEESTFTTNVEVKVEQHQGQLYCFEVENDRFVTQGKDPEELIEKIFAAYPKGTKINCEETNGGDLLKAAIEKIKSEAKTT
jgi:hypothetical protein